MFPLMKILYELLVCPTRAKRYVHPFRKCLLLKIKPIVFINIWSLVSLCSKVTVHFIRNTIRLNLLEPKKTLRFG